MKEQESTLEKSDDLWLELRLEDHSESDLARLSAVETIRLPRMPLANLVK